MGETGRELTLKIALPANRDYIGAMWVLDEAGYVLAGPYRVAGRASDEIAAEHGNPTRATTLPYGDPPLGCYRYLGMATTGTGSKYRQDLFGSLDVIILAGIAGNAALADANGRFEIVVHAGPLEGSGELRASTGHFRISDPDLKAISSLISRAQTVSCVCEEAQPELGHNLVADLGDAYRDLKANVPRRPVTFNDKLLYKMAYDRRRQLTTFADKVAVRDYVTRRVGEQYLTTCYAVYRQAREIDWASLPREFALKASHGSGGIVLVWDGAQRGRRPAKGQQARWDRSAIHPDDLAHDELERIAEGWLRLRYEFGIGNRHPEWCYAHVRPRLLAEELLIDSDGKPPRDYKFFMIEGKCAFIQVDYARFEAHRRDLFSPRWELLPVRFVYPNSDVPGHRPAALEEMLVVAEELSRGVDFVRVDLYEVGARVLFGELTNYPEAALGRFYPDEFDRTLGALWHVPTTYGHRPRS